MDSQENLIKRLYLKLPRGAPFDTGVLRTHGLSSALTSYYVQTGWLVRLGRGVFMFPNDDLQVRPTLNFLVARMPGLHVGGKTALGWRGIRHNLPASEVLDLWSDKPQRLPQWFIKRFPSRHVTRHLFSRNLPSDFGLQPLPEAPYGPPVSVPERAILEMLSDVGVRLGIEDTRNILEGVRSLRAEVLRRLLKNCLNVKTVRLCMHWAEELELPWADVARKTAKAMFGSGRWVTRMKDGSILILKP